MTTDCSQEEIKKKYRQECLKYHPDKNVNSSMKVKEKFEERFKQIQEAYSLIGTKKDRRKYDFMTSLNQRSTQTPLDRQNSYHHPNRSPFDAHTGNPYTKRRRAFYVNGIDVSQFFNPNQRFYNNRMNTFSSGGDMDISNSSKKSIYVEHVTIPLEKLYSGSNKEHFILDDNMIGRYMAAFRGGVMKQITLHGLLTTVPLFLWNGRPILSLLYFLTSIHLSLPRPDKVSFVSNIKTGWKGGTKLRFSGIQPGIEVVFVIKEGKHDRFIRRGDDLKTEVIIGKREARFGCTFSIEPLNDKEIPITVQLKPGQVGDMVTRIKKKRHRITVPNKGWPKSDGNRGNLVISISVVPDAKANQMKNQQQRP